MPSASTRGRRVTQNPLFFGGFAELEFDACLDEMQDVLRGGNEACTAMVRDIRELGQVLYGRRYRYLRYSHVTFAAGAMVTVALTLPSVWSGAGVPTG